MQWPAYTAPEISFALDTPGKGISQKIGSPNGRARDGIINSMVGMVDDDMDAGEATICDGAGILTG
jgi:hypothetical protein